MPVQSAPDIMRPAYRGENLPVAQISKPRLGMILGAGQHVRPADGAKRFDLSVIDLDAGNMPVTLIKMEFFGHGIAANPVHPELISIFEKRGKGACEIDLKKGAVTRVIETTPDRQFYGHGAYSPDGRLLYSTETVMDEERTGIIAIRDADTHDLLGRFPSYGASPHDCHLIDDGRTMVITNGGGPLNGIAPSVVYVDVATERLLDKLEFDAQNINAGHLAITSKGGLAVVSAQREGLPAEESGGITLKLDNGDFHTLTEPVDIVQRLSGETLSVCIHEASGVVGTTTPDGNLLAFWELGTGTLLRHYDLQNPRGIEVTQDGEFFVVSYGLGEPPEALCLLSVSTLDMMSGCSIAPTGITGSHLFSYSFPRALRS